MSPPPADSNIHVSVVVVAHNEEAKIGRCVRSLAAQDYPREHVEYILVNDSSTDRTVAVAQQAMEGIRVIDNPSRSISSNRNRGWREARGTYVLYTDADCEVPPHWVSALVAAIERLDVGAVGSSNRPPTSSLFYRALGVMLNTYIGSRGSVQGMIYTHEHEVPHLPGLNVIFKRSVLERLGGYDEQFRLIGEDEDLSWRLRYQGDAIYFVPGVEVIHHQRSDVQTWMRNMYNYGKGRTWLIRRHPQAFEPALLIPPVLPALMGLYLPAISTASTAYALKAGKPMLAPMVSALFAATHIPYGLGQLVGLVQPGDSEVSRQRQGWQKLGMVVLKNAGNKGDEAIFVSFCQRLLKVRDRLGIHPYVIGLGPSGLDIRLIPNTMEGVLRLAADLFASAEDARELKPTSAKLWGDAWRLANALGTLDRLVFCGGQWIHDLDPTYHAVISALLIWTRSTGGKTGVFCVGSGPLHASWSRSLLRLALGHDALIVVRDPGSAQLYQACGLHQAITATDIALELKTELPDLPQHLPIPKLIDNSGGQRSAAQPGLIGLSPCAWFRFENLYTRDEDAIEGAIDELLTLIDGLTAHGHALVLLPTMNPEDYRFSEVLVGRCARPEQVTLLDIEPLTPNAFQGLIARLDLLVAMRLHPAIFAFNTATPCVALNYARKVREFCQQADLTSQLVLLDEQGWGQRALDTALNTLADREPLVARMNDAHKVLRKQLEPAYEALWSWVSEPQ